MNRQTQVFSILLLNLILVFGLFELNHTLSRFGVSLHLELLTLTFVALYLRIIHGIIVTTILALFTGSQLPVEITPYLILFLTVWLIIVWSRRRIRRENPRHVRTVATIMQALFVLVMALKLGGELSGTWIYWQRICVDLGFSLLVLNLCIFLWVEFQRELLYTFGWNLHAETPSI